MTQALKDDARSWDERRSTVNHDWLLNKFLTFLLAWRTELDRVSESAPLPREVKKQLAGWQRRRSELTTLLGDAEQALSPARVIEDSFLSGLSAEARGQVRVDAHECWLKQSGIVESLEQIGVYAQTVDVLVDQVLAGEHVNGAGTRIYEAVVKLSHGLSSLRTIAT